MLGLEVVLECEGDEAGNVQMYGTRDVEGESTVRCVRDQDYLRHVPCSTVKCLFTLLTLITAPLA